MCRLATVCSHRSTALLGRCVRNSHDLWSHDTTDNWTKPERLCCKLARTQWTRSESQCSIRRYTHSHGRGRSSQAVNKLIDPTLPQLDEAKKKLEKANKDSERLRMHLIDSEDTHNLQLIELQKKIDALTKR
jgi:hypothetical protein